jgi:hypothetical protein
MTHLLLGLLTLCVSASLVTPASAQSPDPRRQQWNFDERYYREGEAPEEEKQGIKLCSVYAPNNWRDTIPVPATWRWSDCRDYAVTMGATHVHLVCIFADGHPMISVGGPGELPEPNCGWGRRRR